MRAMAIHVFGGTDRIEEIDAPEPLVGPDSVLVRVRAAGVNPVDTKIRQGSSKERWPHFFPLILGWDAAGEVEQVGPAVTNVAPGDEVYAYARKDFVRDGTYAELVAVRAELVAHKPATATWEQAGATPLAALTAWQLLHEGLGVRGGETVLIHGASGGVGSFAVQLARAAGAHVIATGSARNHDHLRELGAAETIDYNEQDVAAAVGEAHPAGVDHVADLVGGDTLEQSAGVIRRGGNAGSILVPEPPAALAERGADYRYVFVRPDGGQLTHLAGLIDEGELRVHVQEALPLADAARAHEQIESGHTRGKLVLTV
jgi:NADPH:quinone reductase-like Zn-dependent oxidoreductase